MKKVIIVSLIIALIANSVKLFAWGRWGHQHINKAAILALPPTMKIFFYNHADFIVEESVVPDIRKYTINDKAEPNRHYIDLEGFNYKSADAMPQTMQDAVKQYGNDTVQKYGIVPWYIQDMMAKLTKAFKEKNKTEILFLAADLGHYMADAHMPLHTSINHDGQLTGQKGIHAFWESQLPELFGEHYNLNVRKAKFVNNIPQATWAIIAHSHLLADTLLLVEKALNDSYPKDSIYKKNADGKLILNQFNQPVHTKRYAARYHKLLKGMVERQVQGSIRDLSDFWYTAWVNAGRPDLSGMDPATVTKRNRKYLDEDMRLLKKQGKVMGFSISREYI